MFTDAPEARFVGCLLLFLATMTLVAESRHLGLLWVGVEATTLASAPLIYFHRHHRSLEATWKYLLICSVGIALALQGNFFLAVAARGAPEVHLTIEHLLSGSRQLDPLWLKAAFLMFLVGYGTKMGLAPMHTWLPDAHSEAPSVISALLSGALLNCAFLGILRIHAIMGAAGLGGFSSQLLIGLGMLSMAVAAVFIIEQADFKRMLAYSSVEHMGILSLGAGLGGVAGMGSLLHMVNHSFTKAMLFLLAGNILAAYRTKSTRQVRGLLQTLPLTGPLWVAGFLAIAGSPPFGLFVSELIILKGALQGGHVWVAAAYLTALGVIFVGMARSVLQMAYGATEGTAPRPARVPGGLGRAAAHGAGGDGADPGSLHAGLAPKSADRRGAGSGGSLMRSALSIYNAQAVRIADCPTLSIEAFTAAVVEEVPGRARLVALLAAPWPDGSMRLLAVLAGLSDDTLSLLACPVGNEYPSLTPSVTQAHWFEREIAEVWGIQPLGHPWLKPIRFQASAAGAQGAPIGVTDFFYMRGKKCTKSRSGPCTPG